MEASLLRKNISQKLNDKDMSIGRAEKLSNIGNGTVRNFLSGKTKRLTMDTISALCITLNCSVKDLIDTDISIKNKIFWDCVLFQEIIEFVCFYTKHNKITLSLDIALELTKSLYTFCYKKGVKNLDREFSEWYLNDRLKLPQQ